MGHRIAIVGAGMSGMSCAHELVTAGAKVVVFDKGRALGGRLATRLSEGWAFDHGAPSFHSKGTAFSAFMEHLVGQCSARCVDPPGRLYKGRPHMHSLLTPLVQGLELYQSVEISEIKQTDGGWRLQSKTGRSFEQFDTLLLCIPALQAQALVRTINANWATTLGAIEYGPCLTMLLGLEHSHSELQERHFEDNLVLAQQIRQRNQKQSGETARQAWVVHATGQWSAENLDLEREDAARFMLHEFIKANALSAIEPAFLRGHRWRYARVSQPLGEDCLWDAEARLGLAGDWCIGSNVEDAYHSGAALAERVMQV